MSTAVKLGVLSHAMMSATGFVKQQHAGYNYYTFAGNPARTKGNVANNSKSHPSGYGGHVRTKSVTGKPLPEAKPIVFLHGVGIGILPYVDFIYSLVCTGMVGHGSQVPFYIALCLDYVQESMFQCGNVMMKLVVRHYHI